MSFKNLQVMPIQLSFLQPEQLLILQKWRNDEQLSHLVMAAPKQHTLDDVQSWLSSTLGDQNQRVLGIYESAENERRLVGLVRFMYIDWTVGSANFGIFIGESDLRGRGLGKLALEQAIEHARDVLKLKSLNLQVVECNLQAIKLYKQYGFRQVALDADAYRHGDGIEGVYRMELDLL